MAARPVRDGWPLNPVIYQVYPRSFRDTTGSGEGDLRGIIEGADHIASLGVDAVWLSPVFTSPMCDGGYDVADQTAIDPRFGTLDDFAELIESFHARDLRVMMDMVFNHTSNTHEWFRKSVADEPGYRDYYVWADARPDGSPPSNWIGYFGDPVWRWFPQREKYCLHQFLNCQPCLDHHNPAALKELEAICRFWCGQGVDGFRFDAVTSFFYDREFRDNPPASDGERALIPGPGSNPFTMQKHDNDMLPHDCANFSGDIRQWAGPDKFLIGEINQGLRSVELARGFSRHDRLDAGYTVDLPERGLKRTVLADLLERLDGENAMAWWLSSHDQKRAVTREGDGSARDAKMLNGFLLALPGPILMFQGEELGQPQVALRKEQVTDPFDLMYWPDAPGREGARAPLPWNDASYGGFTTGEPWLPVAEPEDGPVSSQNENAASVLNFTRTALAIRRERGMADGDIALLDGSDDVIAARISGPDGAETGLFVNLTSGPVPCPFETGEVVLTSAEATAPREIPARAALWLAL